MTKPPAWRAIADTLRVSGDVPALTDALADNDSLFDTSKSDRKDSTADDAKAISTLQDRLYAEGRRALLIVLQGMDTSGKDGTVRAVFNHTGPIGVQVTAFGRPTDEELAHDYLWRIHKAVPKRGYIGIFTRSHYEDVLVVRVKKLAPADDIERRYAQINAFEQHLVENGTTILKFMLHISLDEQAKRLNARLDDTDKQWKFNPGDLDDRKLWTDYMAAYRTMLERCSTPHAPWYLVPSDSKSRRNAIIASIVRGTLEEMHPTPRHPGYDPKAFTIE